MIIIFVLIVQSSSLQGLASLGRAIKTQQQINYYLKKYDLSLKIHLMDLQDYTEFDETSSLRYATKCTFCNKTFRNSSYLQLHQYSKHFDQNMTETIIQLNYFCEFTNCLKPYGMNNLQTLPTNVRIQKCLRFSQEFLKYSILEIDKLNKFCDDIVKDENYPFEQETPIWDAFVNMFNTVIAIGYIIGSLYLIKKIQDYVHFLQRRHKKSQPRNNKEKYNVI